MPPPNLTSPNPHNSTSPLPPLTSPNSLNDQMTTLTITNPIPVPAQAAKQSLSTLPTELHLSLLSQNFSTDTDLLFLWSILRNVSKYWRSLTEEFVGRRWLPEVFIVFVFAKDEAPLWLCTSSTYNNSTIAQFTDCDQDPPRSPSTKFPLPPSPQYINQTKLRHLRTLLEKQPITNPTHPPHILSISRFVNDTALPSFSIDWETFTISINWREMFSSLLLEERLRIVRRRRWLRRTGAQKAALQEAPRHALHHALLIHRSSPDDSLREARRKRISGQVMAGKSLRNREGTASPNSSASSEEEVGFDKTVLRLGGDTRGIKWTPDSRENEAIEKVERHLQFMNGFDFGWRG